MEFGTLIDKLDDLVSSAKKVRLGSDVRVDRQETLALVKQLRGAVPEEFKEARWISENRAEMLAEAKRETARILEEAREERARLLGADAIADAAERRAQEVLEDAAARERDIRAGAEDYALAILDGLEAHMVKLADAVTAGRDRLAERRDARPPGDQRPIERPLEREAALVA